MSVRWLSRIVRSPSSIPVIRCRTTECILSPREPRICLRPFSHHAHLLRQRVYRIPPQSAYSQEPNNPTVHFNPDGPEPHHFDPNKKFGLVSPLSWATTAAATIYVGLAFYEAWFVEKPQLQPYSLWDMLNPQYEEPKVKESLPAPIRLVQYHWNGLDSISKLSTGIIATNLAVHLTKQVPGSPWPRLWHVPAAGRNFTLFSAAWVHSGAFHIGANMYVLWNFLPIVGHTHVFEGDPYHAAAFYLSTAVLSSFGQHLTSLWRKEARFIPCGGASGALFGVVGAFATMYPQEKLGIMFLPFRFNAIDFLGAVMLFDLIGATRGFRNIRLGHGAHLTGALVGIAYAYFDGGRIWQSLVRGGEELRRRVRGN